MHRPTCTHRKRQERKKRGEREINSRQLRCISINPPVYSFTLFILVLEPDCQTLFPHKWHVLADMSLLKRWQQTYDFISRVWIVSPILGRKAADAIKFVLQITAQLLEGDEVCLLSPSYDGERMLFAFEEFEWDPTQHLWEARDKERNLRQQISPIRF